MNRTFHLLAALCMASLFITAAHAVEPIKVFILAGQSNMQGHGHVEIGHDNVAGGEGSLRHLVNTNPAKFGRLVEDPNTPNSPWKSRDDVWVHYTSENGSTPVTEIGNLEAGFGVGSTPNRIGPELGFGQVLGDYYDEPVLIIKTAWGGKSLAQDFRPPSSGGTLGPYYELMKEIVLGDDSNPNNNGVLQDLEDGKLDAQFPDYNDRGYELVGFGWHQGWNDRVNQGFNDQYEANLANFIRDIRADFGKPDLPFVLATTGMSGWSETHPRALSLMAAQLAVGDDTQYPEFADNVESVETRGMYRNADVSPRGNNQAFHWHGNAATYYDIGEGMGVAMTGLLVPEPSTYLMLGLGLGVVAFWNRRT